MPVCSHDRCGASGMARLLYLLSEYLVCSDKTAGFSSLYLLFKLGFSLEHTCFYVSLLAVNSLEKQACVLG